MKICRFCVAALFCALPAFAQSNASAGISMPSITAPSMPTVSVPTIGSGFYTPVAPKSPAVSKPTASAQTAPAQEQTTVTQTNTTTTQRAAVVQAASGLGLTATDLQSMDKLGLLSSGLLGGTNLNALAAAGSAPSSVSTDSLILRQILEQLADVKARLEQQDANGGTAQSVPAAAKYPAGPAARKLLRFVVNGYDVLATCREVYISAPEADGSFLLTGDRKYASNGANRSETFHLLFRAKDAEDGFARYTVTAAVTQDYENEYSFLYQLAERADLMARRTGNFISLRVSDPDWKLDLLLALDN